MFIADRTGLHAQRFGFLAERAFDVHFCAESEEREPDEKTEEPGGGEKDKISFNSEHFKFTNEFSWKDLQAFVLPTERRSSS